MNILFLWVEHNGVGVFFIESAKPNLSFWANTIYYIADLESMINPLPDRKVNSLLY